MDFEAKVDYGLETVFFCKAQNPTFVQQFVEVGARGRCENFVLFHVLLLPGEHALDPGHPLLADRHLLLVSIVALPLLLVLLLLVCVQVLCNIWISICFQVGLFVRLEEVANEDWQMH